MDDQENIRQIRQREMKAKEWQGIQKDMEEGSNRESSNVKHFKSLKQQAQLSDYGAGSPWMERRSLTQEEIDYFEDKTVSPRLTPDKSFSSDFVEEMSCTFPDMVRLEPKDKFDKAIIGVVERINLHVLCYDVAYILNILQEDMSEDEAQEYFDYNIMGSWMGEHTPVYMTNTNYN